MPLLKTQLKNKLKGAERIAVLGIGSALRGDDAAGPLVIKQLKANHKTAKKRPALKLFACETTPENFTGEIKRFKPTHIVIVDAVDMGKGAGSVRIIGPEKESTNASFSTHGLPIKIFIDYLCRSFSCRIITIGIQPESIEFGSLLSVRVSKAIKRVSGIIMDSAIPGA
jgi:hydrogenase 3 maturation protease